MYAVPLASTEIVFPVDPPPPPPSYNHCTPFSRETYRFNVTLKITRRTHDYRLLTALVDAEESFQTSARLQTAW